jgi:hypothetical protein
MADAAAAVRRNRATVEGEQGRGVRGGAESDEAVVDGAAYHPELVEIRHQAVEPSGVEGERFIGKAILEKGDDQLGRNAMRCR